MCTLDVQLASPIANIGKHTKKTLLIYSTTSNEDAESHKNRATFARKMILQ